MSVIHVLKYVESELHQIALRAQFCHSFAIIRTLFRFGNVNNGWFEMRIEPYESCGCLVCKTYEIHV